MKKTLNVNIGLMAFTIDDDAYVLMKNYFDDISSRLDDDMRAEIMEDVESRTSDILRNNLAVPGQVVTISMVKQVIAIIGRAEAFGDRQRGMTPPPAAAAYGNAPRKLYRSRSNKAIAGLCAGIAEYLNLDATLIRVLTVLLVFFGGLSLWVYIILWIIIPLEPEEYNQDQYYNRK